MAQDRIRVAGVDITHPGRVVWPASADDPAPVTKLDLARYLAAAADWMLPHLSGRPASILRAPEGLGGEVFFQRHAGPGLSPDVTRFERPGDPSPYIQIDSAGALVALAQVGAVEFHPWNGRPGRPDRPGRLVFDLDPGPGADFEAIIAAARDLAGRLVDLGLEPFCKTSGGKGLHVVVPLAPERLGWRSAKALTRGVAQAMAADRPDLYVARMAKAERVGRIFIDYLRNDLTATAVAPLSPRARPGAHVSMPLDWEAVRPGLDPAAFTIRTALGRLGGAWAGYAAGERPLSRALARLGSGTGA